MAGNGVPYCRPAGIASEVIMISNMKAVCVTAVFVAAAVLTFAMIARPDANERDRRNHLGHFKKVDGISISSGGGQLTFTGCGHRDFPGCTIYRYDLKENALYRYVHENKLMQVMGAQYWSDSRQFLLVTVPRTEDGKQVLEQMQVAIMNPDGTGLKQLTAGEGIKAAYMLSPDGRTLVYASGKRRTEGKTVASHFDYYARDLATGTETQITDLAFYEISTPYFTPDGKNIVFNYGSPLKLPGTNDDRADKAFREDYEKKYRWNNIIRYPVDGSGINSLPEPWFVHGIGSSNAIITRDGSLWFEGRTGGISYYRRYPNGEINEFPYAQLGNGPERYIFSWTVDPAGSWMAILYQDYGSERDRWVAVLDTSARTRIPVLLPDTITNITVH